MILISSGEIIVCDFPFSNLGGCNFWNGLGIKSLVIILAAMADQQQQQQLPCADYESYLAEPDESCKDFIMQQTMMRIKDPKRSLDFYTRVLGMR